MKVRVTNHSPHPEMLASGQQLAAAGTRGSTRDDVRLSQADRKRLGANITVFEVEEPAEPPATQQPEPAPKKTARKAE